MQLERQLVMASSWSRALLTIRGKLKGTEWDPENSHKINFSDFWTLLNSSNVQFIEYSNYGQTMSGSHCISPLYFRMPVLSSSLSTNKKGEKKTTISKNGRATIITNF